LVSAQLIILSIAIIGFFATGGVSKGRKALTTFRQDVELVKGKSTDFVQSIKSKTKAGMEGKEA